MQTRDTKVALLAVLQIIVEEIDAILKTLHIIRFVPVVSLAYNRLVNMRNSITNEMKRLAK